MTRDYPARFGALVGLSLAILAGFGARYVGHRDDFKISRRHVLVHLLHMRRAAAAASDTSDTG